MHIIGDFRSMEELRARFDWRMPLRFNIGTACSTWPARRTPDAPAIIDVDTDGHVRVFSFAALDAMSNRFANALDALGIGVGDRVAVMVPQSFETAFVHLGIYKCGAIAVPMAAQFGRDAVAHRLNVSGAKLAIAPEVSRDLFAGGTIKTEPHFVASDGQFSGGLHDFCERACDRFAAHDTFADDPAMMLFTSGTTGVAKAALHAHRVLVGHLPGIQLSQDMMPRPGDRMWTPSDWAWAGGLLNALLPSLYFGVSVVAARTRKFDPDWASSVIVSHSVRNLFMPATALRLMLSANVSGASQVRSIGSAGEPLGADTADFAQSLWSIVVNEFYGQTEANTVVGSNNRLGVLRPGSMGQPTPGHRVAVMGSDGRIATRDATGEVVVHASDPAMFLNYWEDAEATRQKFVGEWMLTGDEAMIDSDGYFHFRGRTDDVITSSGYRIGPAEIEDVLASHSAVSLAAVVGMPDAERTQRVVAFVVARDGIDRTGLGDELKARVRQRLSPHQMPSEIRFVDVIPTTESGKIIRRHFRSVVSQHGLDAVS